jgi:hypothetical protein
VDVLPLFVGELQVALLAEGEVMLASQAGSMRVVSFCRCGQANCASLYTGDQPNGSWGEGHRNLPLNVGGTVVLDVVDDVIRMVEVLDRPDVNERLVLAGIRQGPSIVPNDDE